MLAPFGGKESPLAGRRKSDPGKLALAARLRKETTLPLKVDRPASVAGHIQEREPQAASVGASQPGSQLDAAAGGGKELRSHDKTNQTSAIDRSQRCYWLTHFHLFLL